MTKIFLPLLAIAAFLFPLSADARPAQLTVNVQNIDEGKGEVRVLLCDAATFLTPECPYIEGQVATPGTMSFVFEGMPAGEWAVLAYHDANSNHDLDRNILGIPTEQFGFSNNPGYTHKPKFVESRFVTSDQDSAIDIKLSDR